jgi:ABC-2 type transport system ATP-binding protein
VIELQGLAKWYGTHEAVRPLTLTVPRGAVFSLLGSRGAGKTTAVRMMMGILAPSAGRVLIGGVDANRDAAGLRRRVGYLPDEPVFYDFLCGREILQSVAGMHGMRRSDAIDRSELLLAELDLQHVANGFVVDYAPGQKKKLGLACALVHQPSVLILDDPLGGLDARSAQDMLARLAAEQARGATIFLTTRSFDLAQRLGGEAGVIQRGSLAASGTLDQVQSAAEQAGLAGHTMQQLAGAPDLALTGR